MSSSDTEFSSNAHASTQSEPRGNAEDATPATTLEFEVPTRHPDLSFMDGNVAVLTGHQYFLVHKAVLSRHSPVLKDRLATLPPVGTRLLEDRPVLQLSHGPDEMYSFLRSLYGSVCPSDVFPFALTNYPPIEQALNV